MSKITKIQLKALLRTYPMLVPTAGMRLVMTMYTSLIPLYMASVGYLAETVGLISGLYGYASLAMSMLAPALFAYVKKFPLLLFSLFLIMLANLSLLVQGGLLLIGCSQILLGLGLGLFRPSSSSLTVELSEGSNMGKSLGFLNMFYILGGSIGPWLGAIFANAYGYDRAFIASACFALISAGFVVLVWWYFYADVSVPRKAAKTVSFGQFFTTARSEKVYMAALVIVTDVSLLRFWLTLLPIILLHNDISLKKIGFLISSELIAYLAFMPFWSRILDSTTSLLPLFLTIFSPVLLVLVPSCIDSFPLLWLLLVVVGILNAGAYTAAMVICARAHKRQNVGNAMSVLSAASDLGHIFGPLLVALLTSVVVVDKNAFYLLPIPLIASTLLLYVKRHSFVLLHES